MNKAARAGLRIFCNRVCFGLDRRVERSSEERKRLKKEYDERYRAARADALQEKKAAYFRRTYDPASARLKREQKGYEYHVAYCRRYYADPRRKRQKVEYDQRFRATKRAGEYAECMMLLIELWKEIRKQEPNWSERARAKGYYDKINERKRHDRQARRSA